MQITLSFDDFTELPYTSGTVQNISSQATVEICQDDTANTGLILGPGEWFSWSNSTIYARSAWDYEPTATCAVVPFKKGGEGGGSEYILPVATKNTLGGVKSSDDDGKIMVNSDGTMTYNAPEPTITPVVSTAWATNTIYKVNNVVGHGGNVYICLKDHTSSSDFDTDFADGDWSKVDAPKAGANGYVQALALGVTGATSSTPYIKSVAINQTDSFILPPIEVLEEVSGESALINDLHFDNSDAADFNFDADYVTFDGQMHLKTEYNISMSTPTVITDGTKTGYISESDNIDFGDWGNVEGVDVNESPFLLRLRADSTRIQDLAGNTINEDGTFTFTNAGKFGGKSITFDGANDLYFNMQDSINSGEDYTISFWLKMISPLNNETGIIGNYQQGDISIGDWCMHYYTYDTYSDIVSIIRSSTNSGILTTFGLNLTIPDSKWRHYAKVRHNGRSKLYVDGSVVTTDAPWISGPGVVDSSGSYADDSILSNIKPIYIGKQLRYANNFIGELDDVCIIKGKALWTADFTPPTSYLSFSNVIYLAGQEAWGINGSGNFAKLSNNYSAMTDAEKIAMFDAIGGQVPTISQLKTLTMPIKAVSYNDENTEPTCTVTAIPTPQTVTPKGRISLKNYAKLKGVSITDATSGGGAVKVAVTKDNSTYQVYDTTNLAWVDINIADIGTDGMSLADVSSLTSAEWLAYDCMDSGIGFAYYLEMTSTSDTAYTDELTLNVELLGELKSLVKGTDYNYSYVSNDVLQVELYKNGDFRINYNPGES